MILLSMPSTCSDYGKHVARSPFMDYQRPPSKPSPSHRRPKLTLQTSLQPAAMLPKPTWSRSPADVDSPTRRNTYANTFELPPATPATATQSPVEFPSSSNDKATERSRGQHSLGQSPVSSRSTPLASCKMLNNKALPQASPAASYRVQKSKRVFPYPKQVSFRERKDFIPNYHKLDSDEEVDVGLADQGENHEDRKARIRAEDGHALPEVPLGRRQRQWILRPSPDECTHSEALDSTLVVDRRTEPGPPELQ